MNEHEKPPRTSVILCPACGACPTIDVYEDRVRIGEPGAQVQLTKEAWNALIEKIQHGELGKL